MPATKYTGVFKAFAIVLSACTVAKAVAPTNYKIVHQYTLKAPSGISSINTSYFNGTSIVGYGSGSGTGGNTHALYWSTPTSTAVDLNPVGFASSQANYVDGAQIVGEAYNPGQSNEHAFLWTGTAQSAVDLQPAGVRYSRAYKAGDGWQVGYATASVGHAYLWHGTASSAIDLNPSGSTGSQAISTDGIHQVGSADFAGGHDHAALWAGTAASAVDLHPSGGYEVSYASNFTGNQQIGIALSSSTGAYHAMVWNGTTESAVDLDPSGWIESDAYATNGVQQVGSGKVQTTVGDTHALLWNGTAASFIDLGALLPAGTGSVAKYIDANGHIFGLAASGNFDYAIEWAPVPEPSTICLGLLGIVVFGSHIRMRQARRC